MKKNIKTTSDLNKLATNVNNGISYEGYYFKVMNDIAYSYTSAWNANSTYENNYTRIGYFYQSLNEYNTFRGHFDGNGKTISGIRCVNLKEYGKDAENIGLFGTVGPGGEVKGVTLTDCRFTGTDHVGGIAGFNCLGVITDCHVTSTVSIHAVQKTDHHGGIVGYCGYYNNAISGTGGEVSLCTSAATISYTWNAESPYAHNFGGIAGTNTNGHVLQGNVVFGASIKATLNYGAIVGYNKSGDNGGILKCNYYYDCTVNGTANATNIGHYNSDVTNNDGAVLASGFYLNAGTAADPYIIRSVDDWNTLADYVEGKDGPIW